MRRKNILLKAFVTNYSLRVSQVYPTVVISTLFQKQNFLLNNWNFLSSCGQINDLEFTLQILQKQWTFFDRHIEDTITKNMSTSFWAMSVDTMHIIPYLLISFFLCRCIFSWAVTYLKKVMMSLDTSIFLFWRPICKKGRPTRRPLDKWRMNGCCIDTSAQKTQKAVKWNDSWIPFSILSFSTLPPDAKSILGAK